MRKFIYYLLCAFSGIARLIFKQNLRVLAFHQVPDRDIFSKQLDYLKSNYNIIDIQTLKESISNREKKLPDYPLLISFDDGDKNTLENALPVLIEHQTSSCIFVVTEYMNSETGFWWEMIKENEKDKSFKEIRKIINYLKAIKNSERLKRLDTYSPVEEEQLNTADLHLMKKNKMFVGNHSHTHPMFDQCTKSEIQKELDSSKQLFQKWDIQGFDTFAYPNGSWNKLSENILKENGIKLAFLFDHKINPIKINPLRISRIKTNADMPIPELKVKASGLHSLLWNFKRKID